MLRQNRAVNSGACGCKAEMLPKFAPNTSPKIYQLKTTLLFLQLNGFSQHCFSILQFVETGTVLFRKSYIAENMFKRPTDIAENMLKQPITQHIDVTTFDMTIGKNDGY